MSANLAERNNFRNFVVLEILGTDSPITVEAVTAALVRAGNNLIVGVQVNPTSARAIFQAGVEEGKRLAARDTRHEGRG